jgi:hypothetical protein
MDPWRGYSPTKARLGLAFSREHPLLAGRFPQGIPASLVDMNNVPSIDQLVSVLADLEKNARTAEGVTDAPRHQLFVLEALKLSLPTLSKVYGIDLRLDFERGQLHSRALAFHSALCTQGPPSSSPYQPRSPPK